LSGWIYGRIGRRSGYWWQNSWKTGGSGGGKTELRGGVVVGNRLLCICWWRRCGVVVIEDFPWVIWSWTAVKMFNKRHMKGIKNTVGLGVPEAISLGMMGVTDKNTGGGTRMKFGLVMYE
jgi:hypothetical protein